MTGAQQERIRSGVQEMPLPREDVDAITPKVLRGQVRRRRRRRDRLHPRLEHDDAGACNNRGAQRHARCGTQSLRDRWHAVVLIKRLGVLAIRRW